MSVFAKISVDCNTMEIRIRYATLQQRLSITSYLSKLCFKFAKTYAY